LEARIRKSRQKEAAGTADAQVVADPHDDMSHDGSKHDFLDRTLEPVSR
jgi:hypothetical protein